MPVGEIIGEFILRPIIEGLSYLTGYIILKGVTLGAIRLAPLSKMCQKNSDKKKWHQIDWGTELGDFTGCFSVAMAWHRFCYES